MGISKNPNQRAHCYEADEQDGIRCVDCGATLAMSELACTGAGVVTRLTPSPDFNRLILGEIEPEDYGRRLIDETDAELEGL